MRCEGVSRKRMSVFNEVLELKELFKCMQSETRDHAAETPTEREEEAPAKPLVQPDSANNSAWWRRMGTLPLRCTLRRTLACLGGGSVIALARLQMTASSSEAAAAAPANGALFRFGVIADVQWADVEDGYNFARTTRRCYRGALATLGVAVDWWLPMRLDFVAQLGDLIDGQNAQLGHSTSAMEAAVTQLRRLPCR